MTKKSLNEQFIFPPIGETLQTDFFVLQQDRNKKD